VLVLRSELPVSLRTTVLDIFSHYHGLGEVGISRYVSRHQGIRNYVLRRIFHVTSVLCAVEPPLTVYVGIAHLLASVGGVLPSFEVVGVKNNSQP